MKTVKIEGSIWASYDNLFKKYRFNHIETNIESNHFKSQGYIPIAPYTIEIEMPDDIDLQKSTLTALQEKKKLILADNQMKLNQIEQEIQEFMAVEDKS
jgi:hypothetical protein